ncbi:MAG TPA: hypothetical protein VKV34_01090, partial [Thermoleophilia bacterium]|nr:hypothetical protein [Thermoleophilia bacterium]
DFIDMARDAGCGAIVVDEPRRGRDWVALGAVATLPPHFGCKELLETLEAHVPQITRADRAPALEDDVTADLGWRAPLLAVTGPGGTGASTVAVALAQGLADDVRSGGAIVLADFRHRAELAMLHDARDMVPGVQELAEACRAGRPTLEEVRSLTYRVPERGYHLLLGLRRPREWTSVRPRAFYTAVDVLRTSFRYVIADVGPDVEGEDDIGSLDVEERNTMSRTTLQAADAVFVVGNGGMKGTHAAAAVVSALVQFGIPPARIVVVVNRSPRSASRRAEIRTCVQHLVGDAASSMPSPVFLPDRHVDDAFRDAVRLPDVLVAPLVAASHLVIDGPSPAPEASRPRLVRPGLLGHWAPELETQ